MSLINEALRKAKLEAARQDAAKKGVPLPSFAVPHRGGPRSGRAWVTVAAIAVVALAALLFFAGRRSAGRPQTQVAVGVPAEAVPRAPLVEPEETPIETVSAPAAKPDPPPSRTAERPSRKPSAARREGRAPGPGTAAEAPRNELPRVVIERSNEPAGGATRRPADPSESSGDGAESAATGGAPTVYVSEADIPGAGRLELGGIAWSENRPFALINGAVVGPGDRVAGFTVIAIDPRQVELEGELESVILQLR